MNLSDSQEERIYANIEEVYSYAQSEKHRHRIHTL